MAREELLLIVADKESSLRDALLFKLNWKTYVYFTPKIASRQFVFHSECLSMLLCVFRIIYNGMYNACDSINSP